MENEDAYQLRSRAAIHETWDGVSVCDHNENDNGIPRAQKANTNEKYSQKWDMIPAV